MPKTARRSGPLRAANFVPCVPKTLPADLHEAAAETAWRVNPANRPNTRGLSAGLSAELIAEISPPGRIALLTTKYWGPAGVKLTVGFFGKPTRALADKIIAHMNAWRTSANANVTFTYTADVASADVRISLGRGGYYSYLGTDIKHIPRNQQTMNLEGFSLSTPESEYMRVVRHETGHTLGFPHEHMRSEIVNLLDPARTIAYFGQNQGWSPEEVQAQVLTPLEEGSFMGTPADVTSIMCYQLPGSITKNGQPIPGGTDIDASDAAFAAKMYPVAAPPPPVGPSVVSGSVRIALAEKTLYVPDGTWAMKVGA